MSIYYQVVVYLTKIPKKLNYSSKRAVNFTSKFKMYHQPYGFREKHTRAPWYNYIYYLRLVHLRGSSNPLLTIQLALKQVYTIIHHYNWIKISPNSSFQLVCLVTQSGQWTLLAYLWTYMQWCLFTRVLIKEFELITSVL